MHLSPSTFGIIKERLAIRDMQAELMNPQVKEKFSPDEIREKVRLVLEYHDKQDLERARSVEISQLLSGLENGPNGPNLEASQKLDRLEQAKSIAITQTFPSDLRNVIDNQVNFILSGDAAKLPSLRLFKFSISLIADLGTGFADLAEEAKYDRIESHRRAHAGDFSGAFHYSDDFKKIPKKERELQSKIDDVAEAAIAMVRVATKAPIETAESMLSDAGDLLKLSVLGPKTRGKLQDTMVQLATTQFLSQDPATAFKTGQIIAETAEGDPARQIAGIDLMFAALKQAEATSEGNAAALLLSTQPRWGVPLQSKIVQDFVDVQLASLRAGTELIEYSDRNTKAVPKAIDTLRATTPIVAAERLGIEFSL